jgi:hypothetical protein
MLKDASRRKFDVMAWAIDALKKDPAIGRAEALRRAMLAMIEDPSNPWNAYPDYWGRSRSSVTAGGSECGHFATAIAEI